MKYVAIGGARPLSIGVGAPVVGARFVCDVTYSGIRADARNDSEAGSFDVTCTPPPGLVEALWPPRVGAPLSAYTRNGLLATGVIDKVSVVEVDGKRTVRIEVKL